MKAKNILYLMLVAGISMTQRVYAQPGVNLQIYQSINTEVKEIFGQSYSAGSLINVDSSIQSSLVADGRIEDPFRTLKHCFVFFAGNDARSFIGIYKDGQIVWHSDSLIDAIAVTGVNFYATADINHDGKVDIITSWYVGQRYRSEYLWIFGWDGHNGVLENAVDAENQSEVVADEGGFQFEDVNGDGIMEIIGEQDSAQFIDETDNGVTQKIMKIIEKRYDVYSWNGQLYGKWASTPAYPVNGIVPRYKVDAEVHASVVQIAAGFDYRYIIGSKTTSQQDIDQIVLAPISDSSQGVSARPGWGFYSGNGIVDWVIGDISTDFVKAGETDSSFVYRTRALPAVVSYYVRGHNGDPMGHEGGPAWYSDVLENSAHGSTVGGTDPPFPFVALAFLDTLISYKHQCVTLGWLTNGPAHEKDENDDRAGEGIVERLDRRLEKAKDALTKGDSVKARLELDLFVKEVEQLYGKEDKGEKSKEKVKEALTSEGYALLKYNAEYLMDRLPERHRRVNDGEGRGKK
jgi:hypothetical protein